MATAISKRTVIHDCTIYPASGGQPTTMQAAEGVDITLPAIEFESQDIQMMGTFSIADFTRIGNLEITTNINADDPNAMRLGVVGEVAEWIVRYIRTVIEPDNTSRVVGYTVYCKGYVHTIPGTEATPGGEGTGSIAMNAIAYKKEDSDGNVYHDINRMERRCIINGRDLRSAANALL